MKKLILAFAFVFGITSFAQDRKMSKEEREKRTPQERVDIQVKRLTEELGLNSKQEAQVKTLMAKKVQNREVHKKEMETRRASGIKPTSDERAAMKTKMQDELASLKSEMKAILNADQYVKWEQKLDERKDKMMEKRAEKRERK